MNYDNSDEPDFYTMEDFNTTVKIDMHVHINTHDLALIEQAKKR